MNRKDRRAADARARRGHRRAPLPTRDKKHTIVLGGARPAELSKKEMALVLCIAGYVPHLNRTLPGGDLLEGLHVHVVFDDLRQSCIQWKPSDEDFDASEPPPEEIPIPDDPTGQKWQLVVADAPSEDTETNRKTAKIVFGTMLGAVLRLDRSAFPGPPLLDGLHVHFVRDGHVICARYVREGDERAAMHHPNVPTLH